MFKFKINLSYNFFIFLCTRFIRDKEQHKSIKLQGLLIIYLVNNNFKLVPGWGKQLSLYVHYFVYLRKGFLSHLHSSWYM